eukprot:1161044-Pelagomonas_calceolata.AAC.10
MVSKSEALQQKRNREEEQKAKKAQRKKEGQGPGRPCKAVGPAQQPPPAQPCQNETRTAQRKRKRRGSKPAVSVWPGQLKRNWWRPHIIKDI